MNTYMTVQETTEAALNACAGFGLKPEAIANFMMTQLDMPGSKLREFQANHGIENNMSMHKRLATRIELPFDGILTAEEQTLVKTTHPDFVVKFDNSRSRPHALAACMRKIDRVLIKKRAPTSARLISVGGDYTYEVMAAERGTIVHSCTPDGEDSEDVKDASREISRQQRMKIMLRRSEEGSEARKRLDDYYARESVWRCRKKTQDCGHPADVLMSSHVYDMSLEDYVDAMESHGALVTFGALIHSPEMETNETGDLSSVGGYWKREGDRIRYGFAGECQWLYEHEWNNVRRFGFNDQVIVGKSGARATYHVMERRGDTLYFMMRANMGKHIRPGSGELKWRSKLGNRFIVEGFELSSVRTHRAKKYVSKTYEYPAEPFKRALAYALTKLEKGSFSLTDMANKTRSIFADTTINAVRVAGAEKLVDEEKAYFCVNVGLVAAKIMYEQAAVQKELIDTVMAQRGLAALSLHKKAWEAVRAWCGAPMAGESKANALYSTIREYISGLAAEHLERVSWYEDAGYKVAKLCSGKLPVSAEAAEPMSELVFSEPTLEQLLNAAAHNKEFRLLLAKTSATIIPDSRLEKLVDELRAEHGVESRVEGKKKAMEMENWMSDPDCETETATCAPSGSGLFHEQKSVLDENESSARTPGDVDAARTLALQEGLSLDASDSVDISAVTADEWDAYADAAIDEAIHSVQAETDDAHDECKKIYENTTRMDRDGTFYPDSSLISCEGNLNFKADYWNVIDGMLQAGASIMGRVGEVDGRFLFSAVYLPLQHHIARVSTVRSCVGGERRVHFKIYGKDKKPYDGFAMTASPLEIYNGPILVERLKAARAVKFVKGFQLDFVEGVPGCGKTHYIIHAVPKDGLVVAVTKASASDTRERIDARNLENEGVAGYVGLDKPIDRVRTLDSLLVRPFHKYVSTMFFDECFQDHAGKLLAAIRLHGVARVQALGDRKQIPYFPRSTRVDCVLQKLNKWRIHVNKHVTRRCPMDATAAISGFYDYKIRTMSEVVTSLEMKFDVPPTAVPRLEGYKYLVLYQDDKLEMIKRGFPNTSTVGEVQGQTYERVALVRLALIDKYLLNQDEQVDVALSRHTRSFIYMAPGQSPKDKLEECIRKANKQPALFQKFSEVAHAGKNIFSI